MMKKRKWLQKKIAVCLCGGLLYTSLALANPTGMNVVTGTVTPNPAPIVDNMVLNIAGKGAIINWQQFSIGGGQSVYFQMDSSAAAVLNRVVGNDLSTIAGTLGSNGKVFLVNPHGIAFANGATINAPLFVVSTLDVDNDRFMAYANGTTSTLPFVWKQSGGISVEGNTGIRQGAVALLGNTVTVAPGVTFTTAADAVNPTSVAIAAVAAQKVNLNDQGVPVAFQALTNNKVNVGDAVSGGATVQAQRIFLGGGAVNINGTKEKPAEVYSGSETLAIMALADYNFTQAGVSKAVAAKDDLDRGNEVFLGNSKVGTAQSGGTYTATPNANLVILGGSVKALGSTLGSGANTVLVAASTFNKAELKTQDERYNTLTLDVVNSPGNTISLKENIFDGVGDPVGTSRLTEVYGQDISMSASDIEMYGANVESRQGNISLLAGKKFQGTFAPGNDSFTAEAERENGIVIGNSKVSTNAEGTRYYFRILGAGGKIVLHQQSEVVSDNEKNVNQGGVGLVAYSKLAQQSDGTSVYLNGQYESRGGAEQNYVKLQESSSITAGDIYLVGNAIKNGGTLTAKNYLGVSLQAANTITQDNEHQRSVSTLTADNKIFNNYDGLNGKISSDKGDITLLGYSIENNGSIHSDSGAIAVVALDKVSGSGTVTAGEKKEPITPGISSDTIKPNHYVISGADVTERKALEFNTREADGSTGQVITKQGLLVIDPAKQPLTTVTMAWNNLDNQGNTLNTVTIDGNLASAAQAQQLADAVNKSTTMAELKQALEAANLVGERESKKELFATIFTNMNAQQWQEAMNYLLDLQSGPGTFVRGQNQSRQGLMRENQQQQARQMRSWDQMRLGSALEALRNKSNGSLVVAPGVSFSPAPLMPQGRMAPPGDLPHAPKGPNEVE